MSHGRRAESYSFFVAEESSIRKALLEGLQGECGSEDIAIAQCMLARSKGYPGDTYRRLIRYSSEAAAKWVAMALPILADNIPRTP
jgi:hypothetical protein